MQALDLRGIATKLPREQRKNANSAPWGSEYPLRDMRKGCIHNSGEKPYHQRWGAPAHVGLPELRGCRRGERSKPARSRSWWHWSKSGWSYWWGSAGNLLLETNTHGGRGECWEQQTVEICEKVTTFYPLCNTTYMHTATQTYTHTAYTGSHFTNKPKNWLSAHEKELWIKNLKPLEGLD